MELFPLVVNPSYAVLLHVSNRRDKWREREPRGSAQDESIIRDQFILGLKVGAVQRELQRQVRRQPELNFTAACTEARALEAEWQGEEQAWSSRVTVPPPPTIPDLEKWKETVKAEIRQEMQSQLSTLSQTLEEEVRRQMSPAQWGSLTRQERETQRSHVDQGRYSPAPRTGPDFQWDRQDFSVAGVKVPGKGVVIVEDECLGAEKGVLGMNVITECWKVLFQGEHPGAAAFGATVSLGAKGEWERAFAICRKIACEESPDDSSTVEVDVRSVQLPAEADHPIYSLKGEGLTTN
ncbi:hypothetical protein SKAU_G00078300 [Synaphobranchus kaupii]|uniref:Uncharacterized protein n=1 Tax=Synaphobranchus kaupii TaxID=118154 RepID=A0A9Q1J474_SYNKA|nr:hypothetical protein SKAU_G00078300 [Synaphobranchus kaupii]